MKARRVGTLLLATFVTLLSLQPAPAGAEPFQRGASFDSASVRDVVTAALVYTAPRTLIPTTPSGLAYWGLHGLSALDPALQISLEDGRLRVEAGSFGILDRPAPPPDDALTWGRLTTEALRAGWNASDPVRKAGVAGLLGAFFDEMFARIDPYSRYVPPEQATLERARRAGSAGIGAGFRVAGGGFELIQVREQGPAAEAGLRNGDRVLAVDGQTIQASDQTLLEAMVGGAPGTRVLLTVRRGRGPVRQVEVTRALVPPETVQVDRGGGTLTVRISGFAADTASRVAAALRRLDDRRPELQGVVIDLRGNRGGVLREAVAAAALFLDGGEVARTDGRDPDARHVFAAAGRDATNGLPLVILVDGGSASAAEVMAAGLADQGRAVVVGSSTLGKGLVQSIGPLPDGGELLVSWSRVIAPAGWPIQSLGVLPQVCTSAGEPALSRQLESLSRGQQPMMAALTRHREARVPLTATQAVEIRAGCPAAEGQDRDVSAARRLLRDARAYAAALLSPPPARASELPDQALTGSPPASK